jgi:hypothetical protein
MKTVFTICAFAFSVGMMAQEAGKAGELLKNEAKVSEMQSKEENRPQVKTKEGTRNTNNAKIIKNKRPKPRTNNDYRWNYNYGNSEVFLRIPEEGRFTVEIGDQMMSNATGKFRFFELRAGSVPISIYDDNFLIYRTRLMLRNNSRTVLDFFSDYGLYLLGSFPHQNQPYGVNEWDDIWNDPYGNQDGNQGGNWNANGNQGNYGNQGFYPTVMNNQEFNQFITTVKREASFDDSKIGMIVNATQHTSFKANQISDLLKILSFEKGKLQLAKDLYAKCVDKQNFYQVYEAFNFDSSKKELSAFISKN